MSPDRPRLSRARRLFFGTALVVAPLLLLEFFFQITGLFAPDDPFSIVRDDRGVELIQYNWNQIKPRFAPDKIPGVVRVMVFGESSAVGFPYAPRSSFGEMLRVMLEQSLPGLRVELINLGRVGMNSAEVAELMPRALEYQPDLVIVYSGHNEFVSLRNPASTAAWLGRRLGRIRVARAAGVGVNLGLGAVMLSVQDKMEEEALAPPAPDRVSTADFDNVVNRYRKNLEAMAAACKAKGVPLVLNTLAGNLVGWPPEERVFPKGMSAEQQDRAREAVAMAEAMAWEIRQGQPAGRERADEMERKLDEELKTAPGYAPLVYWRAVIVSLTVDAGDTTGDRADFMRALSLEAHTVTVHRAPPELNQVVRQVAKKQGAWLVENAAWSFDPDLFDDHCHPTLEGQRRIAETTWTLLRGQGFPRPTVEWKVWTTLDWNVPPRSAEPELPWWDQAEYERSQQIDATFLHDLRVRLGVFLGLERDLPFRSELTRRQLEAAIETDHADPLPALLLAAIHLHYGDTGGAAAALAPWAPKTDRLRLAIDRYFTRAVDLRDGAVLFHVDPNPALPPLRGLLTSGIVDPGKTRRRDAEPRPRSYYNAVIKP